jgi:glycogen debranching enzyme
MYDGEFWSNKDDLMQLYDVGMTSMFTMDAFALSELAKAIGRSKDASVLRQRAEFMRALLSRHLWDEQGKIFTNKFANGSFYRRVSPTSFYVMLANASTDTQASLMMQHWMMNQSRFCVTKNGDMAGNNPDGCYWGMPSISADDPAFSKNPQNLGEDGYWRGKVWGPMIQ